MPGIISYGAYIPLWRLARDTIAAAWGIASSGGERSVASNDEDSVTMAGEAAVDCLAGLQREDVDGLYFASTTSPYKEKECSTLVAAAADLRPNIVTADFGNSLRAGTAALRAALDAVSARSIGHVLVTASDCRIGYPGSTHEQTFGDAAAALLIGDTTTPAVTVDCAYSLSNELYDVWRLDKDLYVRSWEDRFIIEHGYMENMEKGIRELLRKADLSARDVTKAVLYAPTSRAQQGLARRLGFDVKSQLQDLLVDNVGMTGCAHALLMLVAALEAAGAGDRILVASYGSGCDALLLRVNREIETVKGKARGVGRYLNSRRSLSSYTKYLSYRGLLETQPGEPSRLFPSATTGWRERNWSIRMHASKCRSCGTVAFPIERVCYKCRSKDEFDEVRLSDRQARVFTFTVDNLAGRSDEPAVPQIAVEFDYGNARAYLLMTDCDPTEVEVDMPVEMTFRRLYEGAGMYQYFWKCRPVR
ncbi:MAG: hydroxymethylglutaryl-CoA synthase family protein [Dehalococcoidia bacterium]|nr:hydroxymethylglutaryl-CoA synthase family protein [Dehalococcoidia bacterium]